ncbi:DUF5908 family protein [Pseudaestuariivita atlantica]|uniref:DUF5908 family protein n=1 Tax=Pseudaestuariivita atlantica TaxID=1317121 RepID=UPI0013F3DE53|nr:DUF5908 family protein [Pseudaestuariivita atlantica]
MPVEIREMVIRSQVEDAPGDAQAANVDAREELRRDILRACERMIRESQARDARR